jgi:hypothetical protein
MALNLSMKRAVITAVSALALISAGPAPGGAQTAGGLARVPSFAKLPDATVAQFRADPHALLTTYASAGLPLSTRVRSLVLTDPSLVGLLIDLAKGANDAQKAAIGAGLAEAARILAALDPQLATQIQMAVGQSGSGPLIAAFIAGSNATQTAAIGGGEGGEGGGGGAGGPTGGVGNSGGSNGGSNPGGGSFGAVNEASPFGAPGPGGGPPGGGLTSSTGQSNSPSKSSI